MEPWVGRHVHLDGYDLVVLPGSEPVALGTARPEPQIVVSAGLLAALTNEQIEAVLAHEEAHIKHGHPEYLTLARAVTAAFGWIPFVHRSVGVLRLALERWADEDAAEIVPGGRATVRAALVRVAVTGDVAAMAFASAATVLARVEALDHPPPGGTRGAWSTIVLSTAMLAAVALMSAGHWIGHAHRVIALAGWCPG
jgi:beta-lactamase regulating signal transducer with metallopeptidase domain